MARTRRRRSRQTSLGTLARRLAISLLVLFLASGAAAGALLFWELTAALPPVSELARYRPPSATQVFADDGTLLGEFYLEKRYWVPIERIPAVVRNAFVAAEDDNFYRHRGIDPVSILRAAVNNLVLGGPVQGGSTITQQVVKALLLTPKKSYERKLKEMILAVRLEQQLTKEEILALYLNHIYLGSGAYGVAAAAQEYFGKSVEDLNLAEAALLAGLPQAPSRYSPFRHWRRAKARQRYVLRRMLEAGLITREQRDAALAQPIALAPRRGNYLAAPYYVEHVRRLLEERYGAEAPYRAGLRVYTPASVEMTAAAEAALRNGLDELDLRQGGSRVLRHLEPAEAKAFLDSQRQAADTQPLQLAKVYEAVVLSAAGGRIRVQVGDYAGDLELPPAPRGGPPKLVPGDVVRAVVLGPADGEKGYRFRLDTQPVVQGALIAMDPRTGEVKAMVGGYDFTRSPFNRATQAARQPGSAFKPLVYAAALDRHFTPASIVVDAPISFPAGGKWWTPRNYEERYFGPTTLREALTFSRNVVTVKVASRIGVRPLIGYLRQLGIRRPLAPNLSLALGSSEMTLLELASAYQVFANQGRRVEPVFIRRILDERGNLVYETRPRARQAIPSATAYQITSMLQDVIRRGTGRRASELGRPAAGKTGTTNDMNDAWFVGYTPQLLAGVWVGFDEKRSLGPTETGGRVAAPIWLHFMERALEGQPIEDFPIPDDIVLVPINPRTGERAVPGDPGAILEAFRRGTQPTALAAAFTAPQDAAEVAAREFFRNED